MGRRDCLVPVGHAADPNAGWGRTDLPEWSVGFIYLPALLGIVGMTFWLGERAQVYFNEVITANQPVSIRIQYSATPGKKDTTWINTENDAISDDIGMYFINADGKNPTKPTQMWTQGEPQSNCHWFPTLDAPNQKHTQRISITFPGNMQSLSNGELKSSVEAFGNNGNHLRTDVWVQNKPHAPYLTMLAVGNWVRVKDSLPWPIDPNLRKKETLPIEYLVEPQFKDDAKMKIGRAHV